MKILLLVEGSNDKIKDLSKHARGKRVLVEDTSHLDEDEEFSYLLSTSAILESSNIDLVMAHYSGRHSLVRRLGDELPNMVITISFNPESLHYVEDPNATFKFIVSIL